MLEYLTEINIFPLSSNRGGIIFVAAYKVNYTGSISAEGVDGNYAYPGGYGGGGAGGSIQIEGYTVTSATITAAGGDPPTPVGGNQDSGAGGAGRIAVYYENSLSSLTATPIAFTEEIYSGTQPTPTPTPIVFDAPGPYGTGADGDVTIGSGTTADLHTENLADFRGCGDGGEMVSYSVIDLTTSTAQLSMSPGAGCLNPGDEVLLINLQGTTDYSANVGNYEFFRVGAVSDDTVLFTSAKVNNYGENAGDDTNMGVGAGQQRVVLMRVPNYDDLTVTGTLTGSAWNGYMYGVIAFRVSGSLTGSGSIDIDDLGYRGGHGGIVGGERAVQGESNTGLGPVLGQTGSGGGAGAYANRQGRGAGGGGHGTEGEDGYYGTGGDTYGDMKLETLFLGPGGGGGGRENLYENNGRDGGAGGGILYLAAETINFTGDISNDGADTPGGGRGGLGGGGAGGSLRIEGDAITLSSATISVHGGIVGTPSYPETDAGDGGDGRSAIYYETSYSGPGGFTPGYINNAGTTDEIFDDDFESGDLTAWDSSVTDSGDLAADAGADYWGDYGLKALIDDTTSIYVQDDTPDSDTRYRGRFYLDPNGLTFGASEVLDIFYGLDSTNEVFRVQIQDNSGTYQARIGVYTDSAAWTDGTWYDITDGWNAIEIEYQVSSIAGADDGHMTLWLDDTEKETLSSVDNDTYAIDSVRMGAMGVDASTSGSVYFDDFESKRYTYIGLLEDPGIPDPEPTAQASWLASDYSYTGSQPHAVTSVEKDQSGGGTVTDTYVYDNNGNMTCREEDGQVWAHTYNEENRISAVYKRDGSDCTSQRNPYLDLHL